MKGIKSLTFEKACKTEGLDAKKIVAAATLLAKLFAEKDRKSMIAHSKVVIMIKAANRLANEGKEWTPDYKNTNQSKYEPRFYMASSGFRFFVFGGWSTRSYVGSRLCFISYEVMKAMVENKNYMKIYNEYVL